MLYADLWAFCLGLNVLTHSLTSTRGANVWTTTCGIKRCLTIDTRQVYNFDFEFLQFIILFSKTDYTSTIWNIINKSAVNVLGVIDIIMMTSSNGNILRVTGPFIKEFTGHRWIRLTKASDAGLWCFLWSAQSRSSWRHCNDCTASRQSCFSFFCLQAID